jgi:1-phosphofructokinase
MARAAGLLQRRARTRSPSRPHCYSLEQAHDESDVNAGAGVQPGAPSPRIVVFSPDPLLSISIERQSAGADEIHVHPAGQGVWVARMASELGAHTLLCGFAGGETGAVVRNLLASTSGEVCFVQSAQPTGSYINDRRSDSPGLIAHAPSGPRSRHEVDELVSRTCAAAVGADALVVCNPYPAETFPAEAYAELVADVRALGVRVLVDLSVPRLDAALEGSPDLVKLNDWELAEAVCGPVDGPRFADAAESLRARGAGTVLVTRGMESAVAFTSHGALEIVPPRFARGHGEGCGDAMMGALAVALGSGAALEDALTLGAAAGAANFLRRGLGSASHTVVSELLAKVVVRPYEGIGAAAG